MQMHKIKSNFIAQKYSLTNLVQPSTSKSREKLKEIFEKYFIYKKIFIGDVV